MANEMIAVLRPKDFFRLNGEPSQNPYSLTPGGDMGGLRLLKSDSKGFTAVCVINAEHTVGTGITLKIGVTDDGADSDDLGKVIRLGITVKKLASGTDDFDIDSAAGTEQTVDITLDATSGQVVEGAKAIANANLDSAGAGDTFLMRVRRIGDASQDTCQGTAVLTHVYIRNT